MAGEFGVCGSGTGVLPCMAKIRAEMSGLGGDLSGQGEVFGKLFHRRDPGVGEGDQVCLEIGDRLSLLSPDPTTGEAQETTPTAATDGPSPCPAHTLHRQTPIRVARPTQQARRANHRG